MAAKYIANKEKILLKNKEWYEKNKAKKHRDNKTWKKKNREKYGEQQSQYARDNRKEIQARQTRKRAENPEKYRERVRRWARENVDVINAHSAKRRARKMGAPVVEKIYRKKVYARDGGVCYLCLRPVAFKDMNLEHVIPLCRGGEHSYANVKTAHGPCNSKKGSRTLEELDLDEFRAVHRGETSDENSASFIPSLMRGKDFGKTGPVKSYALGEVSKVL